MSNEKQPEIKIADNIPGAEYANTMQINHNKDEFHLNFFTISGLTGRVVAKVITNPGHFKRMVAVMTEVLKNYEKQFGAIEEAKDLDQEIGFKA